MEDPLLSSVDVGPPPKTSTHIPAAIGFNKPSAEEESSLGLGFGGLGLEDES